MAYVYRGTVRDIEPEPIEPEKVPAVFDPSKCGTLSGYKQHRKFSTSPCQPCKDAAAKYHREYRVRAKNGETVAKFSPDRCGTLTGHRRHVRHGVALCEQCRLVWNAYKRDYYQQSKLVA